MQLQQVLINLLINAIQAMDAVAADRRAAVDRRERAVDEACGEVVVVRVDDSGPGIRADVLTASVRCLLHDQERGNGHGAVDLPVDRRGAWRPHLGVQPARRRRVLPPRLADRARQVPHDAPHPWPPARPCRRRWSSSSTTTRRCALALDNLFRSVGLASRMFGSAAGVPEGRAVPTRRAAWCSTSACRASAAWSSRPSSPEPSANLPIMFMTGHGDIPMSVRAMKAGAVDFLTKPFRDQDMLDAVAAAIETDRRRREADGAGASVRERLRDACRRASAR